MIVDVSKKILIVGLGLLGGSYARGLTEKGYYVEAITKNQQDCNYAIEHEIKEIVPMENPYIITEGPFAGQVEVDVLDVEKFEQVSTEKGWM